MKFVPRVLFAVNFGARPNPRVIPADTRAVPAAPYQHIDDAAGNPGGITRADLDTVDVRPLGTFEDGAEIYCEGEPDDVLDDEDPEGSRIWWRATVERLGAPCYTLDDEPVDVEEFISDNTADDVAAITAEDIACIRALEPGEQIVMGGGAAAEFVLRRVE